MRQNAYYYVSGTLFSLVAFAHLIRVIFSLSIFINETAVPMWVSGFGCLIPALLAWWAFRLATYNDSAA